MIFMTFGLRGETDVIVGETETRLFLAASAGGMPSAMLWTPIAGAEV